MRTATLLLTTFIALTVLRAQGTPDQLFIPATQYGSLSMATPPLPANVAPFTLDLAQFNLLRDNLADGRQVQLSIQLEQGYSVVAVLTRFSVFTKNATLKAQSATSLKAIDKPRSILLRGEIVGTPNSSVMLALYSDKAFGRVILNNRTYELCKLPDNSVEGTADQHSSNNPVFAFVDQSHLQKPNTWLCATTEETTPRFSGGRSKKSTEKAQAASYTVEVALEGDYDYYLDNGSNTTDATDYAEAVIASASDIYKRDVNTTLTISSWKVWTSADPYTGTSANTMLGQLKTYWQNNNGSVTRTITHLFSGVNGIGGVAYLDGLCNKAKGYSVAGLNSTYTYPNANYTWDTDVAAHEIGHNVGSPHTHSCTWNPPIDSCYDSEGGCFTNTVARKGTIMSYCHLTNQGKVLKFHDRVIELMEQYLDAAECMPQGASLTVNAGNDVTVCGGTTVDFEGSAAGGVEPYEITWTPNDNMTGVNTYTPSVVATTTTSYVLTVMDADSTTVSDTVVVTVNPQVIVSIADTVDVCKGSAVTLTATVTGGTGAKAYTWNVNGVENNTNINSFTYTPTTSGTVGLLVVDTKGCNANDAIYVRVNNTPNLTLTGPTGIRCADDNSVLKAKIVGGTPPYAFTWSSKDGVFSSQPDSVIVSPDSGQTYNLLITDAKGCIDTAVVSVAVHNVKMSLSTNQLNLATLGACQTTENVWITVINNGDIPFTINTVTAKSTLVTSKDFPVTVHPNSTHLLPLQLTLPSTSPILDTLVFAETLCKKPYKVQLTGVRGGIAAMQSSTSTGVPVVATCSQQVPVAIAVEIDNQATKAANVVSAKSTSGAKVVIQNAPVVVAAKGKTTVQVVLNKQVVEGMSNDTVVFTYNSEDCASQITAPIEYTGETITISKPDSIVFTDNVSPALEDVSKQYEVGAEYVNVETVTIGDVVVSGPFSTTLASGTTLVSGSSVTSSVTFHPSQMEADGSVTGRLTFTVNECNDTNSITLQGIRTVVSVQESQSNEASCWLVGNDIYTEPADGAVVVFDIAGNVIARRDQGSTRRINMTQQASGVYVVLQELRGFVKVTSLMLTK